MADQINVAGTVSNSSNLPSAEEQAKMLTAEHEALKAKKAKVLEETKKANATPKREKPSKKEVTLSERQKAELLLVKICQELKLSPPVRIAAKSDSKSGQGALKAFVGGGCKVSVRSNDVVIYMPVSELGYGKVPKGWEHCAQFNWSDPNLEKAMRKGLKDKVPNSQWIREIKPAMRAAVDKAQPQDLAAKAKRLEAELKAIREQQQAVKAKARVKKPAAPKEEVKPSIQAAVANLATAS